VGAPAPIPQIRKEDFLSEVSIQQRAIQIEHVTMRSPKDFAEVRASLERSVPKLDESIAQFIASGKLEQLKVKLEEGPELAIFLSRDHGSLLAVAGHAKKAVQYEIGNPLTASKMTRHKLAAGLYAPLRVILYADESGGSVFEYDKPSTLFGQYGDPQVSAVARGLDAALDRALRQAMK
jgi:uncharacterized protein (DUF302 family)